MSILSKVFAILTIVLSVLGVVVIVIGMGEAKGAPQEEVVICLGLAFAVIPYCIARSISELRSN